ncbi:hypothetical protein GGD56_006851 [Rhizobium mongolense]|uniref:Uncharacterized protein n=2 Tax=Rhizobium mongolense TaxID=57676 RepID=A0ABR6IYK7_9HYPH|nr:hypothetical protein [Rhizobium mongolense]TVZ75096.1 hypothetical protein BCL32_0495 [Rhizobium mongolense USDA 1844]
MRIPKPVLFGRLQQGSEFATHLENNGQADEPTAKMRPPNLRNCHQDTGTRSSIYHFPRVRQVAQDLVLLHGKLN